MSPGVLSLSDEERSIVRLLTQNLSAFARAISATVPGMGLHLDVILWYEPVLLGLILLPFYCPFYCMAILVLEAFKPDHWGAPVVCVQGLFTVSACRVCHSICRHMQGVGAHQQ